MKLGPGRKGHKGIRDRRFASHSVLKPPIFMLMIIVSASQLPFSRGLLLDCENFANGLCAALAAKLPASSIGNADHANNIKWIQFLDCWYLGHIFPPLTDSVVVVSPPSNLNK